MEIYPSLMDFEKSVVTHLDSSGDNAVVFNALQTSIDSFLREDQDPFTDTVAANSSQQATATHWLSSAANSHTPDK